MPRAPLGTPFQREVWDALARIPYGETRTYADVARRLGRPSAVRAVGAAIGRNPLCVVVPCHRVVGAGGALTGYAGGLVRKQRLLEAGERAGRQRGVRMLRFLPSDRGPRPVRDHRVTGR